MLATAAAFAFIAGTMVLGVASASGPSIVTSATTDLDDIPGQVTGGGNVAYIAKITNTGNSVWSHLQFHNLSPVANWKLAKFVQSSCDGYANFLLFTCKAGTGPNSQLGPGESAVVTVVWKTPSTTGHMLGLPFWTIKSQTLPNSNKKKGGAIFPAGKAITTLLDANDPNRAGTFVLDPCGEDSPTIETNPELDENNPLATRVCIPDFTPPGGSLGLLAEVAEGADEGPGGFPQASDVCVAAEDCETPFSFDGLITFTFFLREASFDPPSELLSTSDYYPEDPQSPITEVFYDGDEDGEFELVPNCDDYYEEDLDPCYESIETDGEGTTTVVTRGSENGQWDFG
jgi:hypothetical protein